MKANIRCTVDLRADEVIKILNARATALATDNDVPEPLQTPFEDFLRLYKDHWGQQPSLDPTSALGRSYYRFWQAESENRRARPRSTLQTEDRA